MLIHDTISQNYVKNIPRQNRIETKRINETNKQVIYQYKQTKLHALFVQRINLRLVIRVIRRVARYPGYLINDACGILGSSRWSSADKYADRLLFHFLSFVVRVVGIQWKFVEAARVISTGFLWEWHVQRGGAHHSRHAIDRSFVSRREILVQVGIWREIIERRARVEKSSCWRCFPYGINW